jgi:hypothetical protein
MATAMRLGWLYGFARRQHWHKSCSFPVLFSDEQEPLRDRQRMCPVNSIFFLTASITSFSLIDHGFISSI